MNADTTRDELALEVDDLTVRYRTNVDKVPTLKTTLRRLTRRTRTVRHITALEDVSFTLPRGNVLGVIGANGAGKSTLLRAIAGILPPAKGRVVVRGEVTTLLSLGIGFNKALSGRENVFLGGLAAGRSPEEVEYDFEKIVAFAELEEWIDMPVSTYSSGMYGRLAFAVATQLDPDILLIDETLSAGDASFREKAKARMMGVVQNAGTIVLVTHGLGVIKELATDCVWLHKGHVMAHGEPDAVVDQYTEFVNVKRTSVVMEDV
ncbi:MAG: ABC transporter ATP-binding protein [Actinobacteria bacterium]|nr:ABC transporter ATP-binding protein [Actinomycetota bacterium]